MNEEYFGYIIKNWRQKNGITRKNLLSLLEKNGHPLSLFYFSKIERNIDQPSPQLVFKFAKITGINHDILIKSVINKKINGYKIKLDIAYKNALQKYKQEKKKNDI
tara:strand:+ start:60 stop:377 length:318 start_codon:yes stop_codon:yes gene_type:complete